MSTKTELLTQIKAIDGDAASELRKTKATKATIQQWLDDQITGEYSDDLDENGNVIPLDDDTTERTMPKTLAKYRPNYRKTQAYSGRKSLDNGDDVALLLAGLSPEEVLTAAEEVLGLETGELATKYGHLNPGQQRMNGGNRIRAAIKRGDVTEDQLAKAILH